MRTAVIGAGPAGLVCADALRGDVVVFEKSRAIGGRVATRAVTMDDGRPVAFDHGAPAIRPVDSLFAGLLSDLADAGSAALWKNGLIVGTPGMRDLFAPLAEGLDIRFEARVDALERTGDGWSLRFAPHEREGGRLEGTEGPFDRVVLAIPAHQAAALLGPVRPRLAERLAVVRTKPSWTLMAAFEADQGADVDPGLVADRSPVPGVEWLVRDAEKPGRDTSLRTWTLQMDADWSTQRLEHDRDAVMPDMLNILRARSGETGDPLIAMAHRWRYAQTVLPLGEPFAESDGLYVGGDWTLGPCVEDAWRSGKAIAAAILEDR